MKRLFIAIFAMLAVVMAQAQMTSKEDYEPKKIQYIINNGVTKFKVWFVDESNICMFSQEHVRFCSYSNATLGIYNDCLRVKGISYRDVRGILENINNINQKDWYRCESGMCVGRYNDGDFFVIIAPEASKFKNKVDKENFLTVCKIIDDNQKAIEQQQ